jgi:hypothetical protein
MTVASGTAKMRITGRVVAHTNEETVVAEQTKRGDEDRKQEDEEMTTGEPVGAATGNGGNEGTQTANTTKDKGVQTADDTQRGAEKKS